MFTGVNVSSMAMWSKKPVKTLEKPYVGAYSHSQALHVVVITKQTYARGITVALRRFFLAPLTKERVHLGRCEDIQ